MIPQPAFRYYSLLHRRQAEGAKVQYKMHANHPPCRSSCYASLTLNSALLPALASGSIQTAASADSQLVMEISIVKEFKGLGTVHVWVCPLWQNRSQTFPEKGGTNKPQIRAKNKDWPFSFSISSDYICLPRLLSISIPRFVNQRTLLFPSISTLFKKLKFKLKALWQKWTIHHKSDVIQLV